MKKLSVSRSEEIEAQRLSSMSNIIPVGAEWSESRVAMAETSLNHYCMLCVHVFVAGVGNNNYCRVSNVQRDGVADIL